MTIQATEQQGVIDFAKLKDTFMGDLNIIKEILSAYQDTFQNFEQEFKTLYQEGKQTELSRLVHGLKGSSANIRADRLASQAAHLQQLIDSNEHYAEFIAPLFDTFRLLQQEIIQIKGL